MVVTEDTGCFSAATSSIHKASHFRAVMMMLSNIQQLDEPHLPAKEKCSLTQIQTDLSMVFERNCLSYLAFAH